MKRAALVLIGLTVGGANLAEAQENACKSSYEASQELRAAGQLARSLRELDLCISSCPRILGADCQSWKAELSPRVGTIAFSISNPGDDRIIAARIDGDPYTLRTGASSVRLDPGEHVVEIAEPGLSEVRRTVEARAGAVTEVSIALVTAAGTSGSGGGITPPGGDTERPLPVLPFVLGAIGASAVTAGVILGIHGQVKVAELRDTCAKDGPYCARRRVDTIEAEWQVGAVLAGTGVAMLGVAVILYAVDAPVQANASGIALRF